jgi:hypothetical protein
MIIFLDGIFLTLISSSMKYEKNNEILFLRTDMIGDFFVWAPLIVGKGHINYGLVCSDQIAEYAKQLNIFKNVYPLDFYKFKTNLFYRYKKIYFLLKSNPKIVVNSRFSRSLIIDDSIIRAFSAINVYTVGADGDNFNINRSDKLLSDKWYNFLVKIPVNISNEIIRNKYLFNEVNKLEL